VESSHIYLGDTKISGNAQTFYKDKMLHHGTLLFESDLDTIHHALKPVGYHKTSAIESTRAHTTNIKNALGIDASIDEFMQFILEEMLQDGIGGNLITLTEEDISQINELAQSKYNTWEWNIGETPEFWIDKRHKGEAIHIHVKKGVILESSLNPDQLEGLQLKDDVLRDNLTDEEYVQLQDILNA
jgi:lipoate-protein ligase A